jgi:serine/threonine protein kinase
MTETSVQIVPRGILESRDVNQKTQSGSAQKMVNMTPDRSSTRTVATAPSPTESEIEELGSSKDRFERVCKFRVAEDKSGELAEFGIEEWSIDDFECIAKLGSGTSGTVFRVRERISGYHLALKVQKYDPQDLTSDVELDIHCNMGLHPNVLRMIDYFYSDVPFGDIQQLEQDEESEDGEIKEYLCMILELCEMGSLFDVIESNEGGWLDEWEAAQFFEGCLRGLKFLHAKKLIHCDVKTANFLVDHNDVVKLADFGMTVQFDEREVFGGSPVFMAPEHLVAWRSGGDNFDHRVDIYGLGVTLFQMLVGDFPFYVIESDEDNKNADSLLACYGRLTLADGPDGFDPKRLDLRVLDNKKRDQPFTLPKISFPDCMSEEARDLIRGLMEPDADKRLSIDEALGHVWFQCHG